PPRPPRDCCRSDAHSDTARTNSTSCVWRASFRTDRGAPLSRVVARLASPRPSLVLLTASIRGQGVAFDFLDQPTIPIGVLDMSKRKKGTTFRIAPRDTRVLLRIIERAAGEVEHFAHFNAAGDQILACDVDVVYRESQAHHRARFWRGDSLAKDDRGIRVVRR